MHFFPKIKSKMESKEKPTTKIKIIIGLFIILIILVNLIGLPKTIKNFFYSISSPIQKKLWVSGQGFFNFLEAISQSQKIKKENQELKSEIASLIEKTVKISELEKENKVLRAAFDANLKKEFDLILVEIIGKDIASDVFIIDKGLKNGVQKDAPVITWQKVLIGKVEEVYDDFSKVTLIYNKNMNFDVRILRREEPEGEKKGEIYGVINGEGNGQVQLNMVPKEQEIKEGDMVITSDLGGLFPEGLLIGPIREITKSDVEPFQKAKVTILSDFREVQTVFVIK